MLPHVLVVEDDPELRAAVCETLDHAGFAVAEACDGEAALALVAQRDFGLMITDVQMPNLDGLELLHQSRALKPDLPVLVMTAFGSIQQAVDAMREGAADYLVKPFEAEVLATKASRYAIHKQAEVVGRPVANDPVSVELYNLAERVAERDATVLLGGESGVGKEVLARFIHERSRRAAGPFVAVNCAAIPDNMLEAMLFGYEKGAFTGAHKACPGKFEQASAGTILLDEISEMDLGLQAKLLRILQEREVERLGGQTVIPLDVRVIATSNRQLREEVGRGRFREDLFYRLNVFPLSVPPLRERPEDIVTLALHLIRRHAAREGVAAPFLSKEAERLLRDYSWPGNVRELENVVQRALILAGAGEIDATAIQFDAPSQERDMAPEGTSHVDDADTLEGQLRQREFTHILEVMNEYQGNRKKVAEALGVSPRTLRYKLAKMRESGIVYGDSDAPIEARA
ncbi:MAG: sigma-54 dependent transcriptional regulator, partial [Gammaproteobacteria bacterium]|nr:sigma-54 dependent transcriptional regulator [Gammaproteobacteria bacterium]